MTDPGIMNNGAANRQRTPQARASNLASISRWTGRDTDTGTLLYSAVLCYALYIITSRCVEETQAPVCLTRLKSVILLDFKQAFIVI